MKMKWKALAAAVIVTAAALFSSVTASAADIAYDDAGLDVIGLLGFMKTDKAVSENDSYGISRAKFAQILYKFGGNSASLNADDYYSAFTDVSSDYWALGYISEAISSGSMTGYLDGSFHPTKKVTLTEALYGVLVTMGFDRQQIPSSSSKLMSYASQLGLMESISLTKSSYLTVGACKQLLLNALLSETQDGKTYGAAYGVQLDESEDEDAIDCAALIKKYFSGPILASDGWTSKLPLKKSEFTYYRNGEKVKLSAIKDYDIVYYSESAKIVWAYSEDESGMSVSSFISDSMTGPVIACSGWENALPFDISSANVYLNDEPAEADDIATYDVIYYSDCYNMVWAYRNKVYGKITSIKYENYLASSVTISVNDSETEYKLGCDDMVQAFSQWGSYKTGDYVTLYLGKDNAIITTSDLVQNNTTAYTLFGVVSAVSDVAGGSKNVTVKDIYGRTLTYSDKNSADEFSAGDYVKISTKGTITELEKLTKSSYTKVYGKVENGMLGTKKLAAYVDIFKVDGTKLTETALSDINGKSFTKYQVLYYSYNASGEITQLVVAA